MNQKTNYPNIFAVTDDAEWIEILEEYFEETGSNLVVCKNEEELSLSNPSFAFGFISPAKDKSSFSSSPTPLIQLGSGEVEGGNIKGRIDKVMSSEEMSRAMMAVMTDLKENLSLLLVDDEADFCDEIKNSWESKKSPSARVEVAMNGLEALEKTRSQKFDSILLDLKMPVLPGFEFYEEFRKKNRATPLLILTAATEGEEIKRLKNKRNPVCVEKSSSESMPEALWWRVVKLTAFGSRDLR